MAAASVTRDEIAAITDEELVARKVLLRSSGISEDIINRMTKESLAQEKKTTQQIAIDIDEIARIANVERKVAANAFLRVKIDSPTRVADAVALIHSEKGSAGGKRRYRKSTRRSKKRRSTRRRQ